VALVVTCDLAEAARRTGIRRPELTLVIERGIVRPLMAASAAMDLHAAMLPG